MVIYPSVRLRGSRECLLLIHGYTGSPYEMLYISEGINRRLGWTVWAPRLPGHAASREEFLRTGARDWLRGARENLIDMMWGCDEVVIGGLSMGGIIATILAVEFSLKKMILYAPAFTTVYQKYVPLMKLMAIFKKYEMKKNPPPEEKDPIKEKLRREYWSYNFYRQGLEFFKLQRMGLGVMGRFDGESLIVVSKEDRTVPMEVVDILEERLGGDKEFVILEKSSHVVTVGEEKERVLKETLRFLEGS